MKATTWGLLGAGALCLVAAEAEACGCFAPPDPTVPVVQAGERILFAMKDGTVTAHIQIQYVGDAKDFGWLLPLPSVPTLELGVDEVFTSLYNSTQPKYRLTRKFEGECGFGGLRVSGASFGENTNAAPENDSANKDATDPDPYNPLVIQDSLGPYDYAVLKADRKDEMFQWLTDNHYFIPVGTDETVGNYIRPGAFFLALKLQSGKAAGELQPVVVRYPSQLPMIPIILTSVAAQENMGVQVWMLGSGRAIPRNFHHAVVNDALVDWQTGGQNYNDVIIRAATEAPDKHAFVTEYAGPSSVMQNRLDRPGRFGDQAELAAMPHIIDFIEYLFRHSWPANSQLVSILTRYAPEPPEIAARGVSPAQFYQAVRYYTQGTIGWQVDFQPEKMAAELFSAIADPTRKASALFDENPFLTRMYTTLSPADMNKDPAFSYNAGLKEVKFTHSATLTYHCSSYAVSQVDTPAVLSTEQGWVVGYPKGTRGAPAVDLAKLPGALRYEVLPEEGAAEVTHDNEAVISSVVGGGARCGCAASPGVSALVLLVLALRKRRTA